MESVVETQKLYIACNVDVKQMPGGDTCVYDKCIIKFDTDLNKLKIYLEKYLKYEIICESVEEITKFIISKGYDTPDYDLKSFAIYTLEMNIQDSDYHDSGEDISDLVVSSEMSFSKKHIALHLTYEIEEYEELDLDDKEEEYFSHEYVCEIAKKHCIEKNDLNFLNYLEVYIFDKNINNVGYKHIGYKWG